MQGAQSASRLRGIGRYTQGLVRSMVKQAGDHEVILALNGHLDGGGNGVRKAFADLMPAENILVWEAVLPAAARLPEYRSRRAQSEFLRERFLQSLQPDHVLVISPFEGFVDDAVGGLKHARPGPPTSAVLHDFIPALTPDTYLADPDYRAFYWERVEDLHRMTHFFANSEATKAETLDVLGVHTNKVTVIGAGLDAAFEAACRADDGTGIGHDYGDYILYPGGFDSRKNLTTLLAAYAMLPREQRRHTRLVLAGHAEAFERGEVERACQRIGIVAGQVVFTGFLSDTDLASLYSSARLIVFPSLHEGFGLPILEAAMSGAPMLAARSPGLTEVMNADIALFDPRDADHLSDRITAALTDHAFRKDILAANADTLTRYSWDKAAALTWKTLGTLEAAPRAAPVLSSAKPRLAYVSPLPPASSGIADYSAEILPELSRHYDIDCVVQDQAVNGTSIDGCAAVISVEAFTDNAAQYDRVIYHMGNSPLHAHMPGLLAKHPGIVVMHDLFLGSLINFGEEHMGAPHLFWKALHTNHGWPAVLDRHTAGTDAARDRWPVSAAILDHALRIVTHSETARDLAERFFGDIYHRRWATVAFPRCAPEQLAEPSQQKRPFQVSTFGFVDDTKCALELIDAWAQSEIGQSGAAEFVFVGENEGGAFGEAVLDAIQTKGLTGQVRITGFLSGHDYSVELARTDIAIQLRKTTRGETSAAVFDTLANGLPTIVCDFGAFSELPDAAVMKVQETRPDVIADALDHLWKAPDIRAKLADTGRALVRSKHAPANIADHLQRVIEDTYSGAGNYGPLTLHDGAKLVDDEASLAQMISAVSNNLSAATRRPVLYLDISSLVATDRMTGIERTALSIVEHCLNMDDAPWRLIPIYATETDGYRQAGAYIGRRIGLPDGAIDDTPVSPVSGDMILALDWSPGVLDARANDLDHFRRRGVSVGHIVYDLLPVQHPEWFPGFVHDAQVGWLNRVARADFAICISQAVADDLQQLVAGGDAHARPTPKIGWFHLGSDMSAQTAVITPEDRQFLETLADAPFALMAGTVEPRKGHSQVLDAFEKIWDKPHPTRLVIAGKKGWMVDALAERLTHHPEAGKRLIWLTDASDALLAELYRSATGLIMASNGEGFGLPLVEAGHHATPILARDLPVFREICGQHASYFKATTGPALARNIQAWLKKIEAGKAPPSSKIKRLNWGQSTHILLDMLSQPDHPNWTHPGPRQQRVSAPQVTAHLQDATDGERPTEHPSG